MVYTPAIKKDHNLYKFFNDLNFTLIKRADLLSQISSKYKVIAIAGTHGKTTISIMLSHLLKSAGYNPSAFFGGISINYDTNFLIGDSEYMIVEADEYDQSFLKLNPTISVVTSLDKDHVDTYNSEHDMIEAYCQLYFNTAISNIDCRNKFYISKNAVDKFQNHLENRINLGYQEKKYVDLELNAIDFQETNKCFDVKNMCEHNINNAIIASQIAKSIGLNNTQIKKGFDNYRGVQRRFEYHMDSEKMILIDDYAHHPEELKALIHSVRKLYGNRELFFIFQPHLFSRTQDLEKEFCHVLSSVDKLIVLDIYPAREVPIPGVSSKNILDKINLQNKWHANSHSLADILRAEKPTLVITAGAGDIHKLIPVIKSTL